MNSKHINKLAVLFFLAISCKSAPAVKELEYSFFVAGHVYGAPGVDNVGVHPPFKKKFSLIRENSDISFGVFTGDIVQAPSSKDWDEVDSDIRTLGKKVYFAAGNHDVLDRELYESRYGKTYYSFVHERDLFLVLDPNLDNWNISGAQLDFLKKELSDNGSQVENIFVFFHHLLWWHPQNDYRDIKPNSFQGRARKINFWDEVFPLFSGLRNKVYMFAGDVAAFPESPTYMYRTQENVSFVASGMGGHKNDNFLVVEVAKDKTVDIKKIELGH